jgi:tail tape-measure protein
VALQKANIIISAEDRTKQAFARVSGSLASITALAGTAVVAGMLAAVKSTAQFNDEMIKAAQSVGTTTEMLSGLKYAGELGGVAFDQLTTGLGKLAKTTEDYRDGLSTAVDAFNKLDLDPTKFRDSGELFEAVAEQLSKLPDGAQKTAIAMSLLGRSGAKLIPLMNGGAQAIKEAREEAEKFGVIVSTEAARASEKLNDNIQRLTANFQAMKFELAIGVIPSVLRYTDSLLDAKLVGDGFFGTFALLGNDDNLDQKIDETISRLESLKKTREALSEPTLANKINDFIFGDVKDLNVQIKVAEQELNSFYAKRTLLSKRFGGNEDFAINIPTYEPNTKNKPTGESTLEKQRKAVAKLVSEFEKAVKPAQEQSQILQETLNSYGNLDPKVRAYLQGLQKQVEVQEQLKKQADDYAELEALQRTSDDEALRQIEELSAAEQERIAGLEAQAQAVRELFDPTLKLLNIQSSYDELLNAGLITQEEYTNAMKVSTESITDKAKDQYADLKRAIEDTFADAKEAVIDFAFGAEVSVGDMVESMLKDLARLQLQRSIFGPLSEGLDGIFSGSGGGYNLLPAFVPSYDVGTNFVPKDQLALVHKGERIIPASQNNAGYGTTTVVVNVDATGGSVQGDSEKAGNLGRQIEGAVRAVLIKEKRPGGVLA